MREINRRATLFRADRRNFAGLPPSAVLFRNATPSVLHQRYIGRVLRSSCNTPGRRLASLRDREPCPGRRPPLWPSDLRDDGGSVAAAGASDSEEAPEWMESFARTIDAGKVVFT
jgi:hypothetical protein